MTVMGLLGVVFVTLKLMEIIAWSWWLVLAPFYVGFIFAILALGVFGVFFSKR